MTGTAPSGAARRWTPGVARWQCECRVCPGSLDDTEHRLLSCPIAQHAFRWAQAVLQAAQLEYDGTAAQLWLYGGDRQLHDDRVVTTLRGAFYEVLPAAQARAEADGLEVRRTAMSEMMRARMLVEIGRDALYVSDDYRKGYGEQDKAARRPRTRGDVLVAWRGLAIEVTPGGQIVGDLPAAWKVGTRCSTRDLSPSNCDSSGEILSYSCVRVEPKRDIR